MRYEMSYNAIPGFDMDGIARWNREHVLPGRELYLPSVQPIRRYSPPPSVDENELVSEEHQNAAFVVPVNYNDVDKNLDLNASRPPTPPDTPPEGHLVIRPCPSRLWPSVPPVNYGAVERGMIFRSSYPKRRHVRFLELLKLRTVLTLVEDEPDEPMDRELRQHIEEYSISHKRVLINANKRGKINTTNDSLCEAILTILHPDHQPILVHCNQGKHRTGCVIACLRKVQQWPIDDVLEEYTTYSGEKQRAEDMKMIQEFEPNSVYEFAKTHEMLDHWPLESRSDSAVEIWDLAKDERTHSVAELCGEEIEDSAGVSVSEMEVGEEDD